MKQGHSEQKRVARTGWFPFWWGNKFNKRLAAKRWRKKCCSTPPDHIAPTETVEEGAENERD